MAKTAAMAEAQRTLVKSPPELWAEVSDPEALARHLGAFGDIRITRTEPETTVAWEGERASGTVELAPAGWGTKVTVKAEANAQPEPEPEPEPEPVAEPAPAAEAVTEPEARRRFFARFRRRRPVEPAPVPEPEPELLHEELARIEEPAAPDGDAVLGEMLDALGTAHRRPFTH